jgi:hypothetical protein
MRLSSNSAGPSWDTCGRPRRPSAFPRSGVTGDDLLHAIQAIIATRRDHRSGNRTAYILALAILIVPVALSLGFNLDFQNIDPLSRIMSAVAAGQVVALLLCGLTLIVLAVRTMPSLPRATPPPSESPSRATTRP